MSYPVSRHEQEISVPANSRYTLPLGNADYIRFHTVPSGVMVKINGGSSGAFIQGETHQAEPGSGELREVSFENTTAGALAVRVIFGLGKIDVSGVATISGVLPLPTGAATEAKQDTQITRLNLLSTEAKQDSIIGVLTSLISIASTADLQAAGNAHLATLAGSVARSPRVVALVANATLPIAAARYVSITNSGATSLTIQIAGQADFTLASGRQLDWPLLHPRDGGYTMSVVCPVGGAGVAQYIL